MSNKTAIKSISSSEGFPNIEYHIEVSNDFVIKLDVKQFAIKTGKSSLNGLVHEINIIYSIFTFNK